MIPDYDRLDDTRLEEVLRERAFAEGADLWIGHLDGGQWRAAFRIYGPTVGRAEEFSEIEAATAPTKREALIDLVQRGDLGTIT
jgi:hypothetical protein